MSTENLFLGNAQSKVGKGQLHTILPSIKNCMDCQRNKATRRRCKNHCHTCLMMEHTCPQRITQSYVSGETPWRILPQNPLLDIHKLPSGASQGLHASHFLLPPSTQTISLPQRTHYHQHIRDVVSSTEHMLLSKSHCWGGSTFNAAASPES